MCCGIGAKCCKCLSWFVPIDPDMVRVKHNGHDYHAECVPGAKKRTKKEKEATKRANEILYPVNPMWRPYNYD